MGHHLNPFIARPEVLRLLAPDIPEIRLLALPQGLALAPIPLEIVAEVNAAAGIEDEDHDPLPWPICKSAMRASETGPVGWIQSDWFGGNGSNTVALWKDGARTPVNESDEM